jgi:hypothetical protein
VEGIIQFGITVPESTGRLTSSERGKELSLDNARLCQKIGKAKPGIIQMLTECMMQKQYSSPMY